MSSLLYTAVTTAHAQHQPDSAAPAATTYHRVGVSYDYTHFNKQFDTDWHELTAQYTRRAKSGTYIASIHYADRYNQHGIQWEAEAYPTLSKTFYLYAGVAYSADFPVFPKFRSGLSLFANLPKAFEADAGIRYLNFDNNTWIYTGSVGKYAGNFWLNAKTYLTPGAAGTSQAYQLSIRRYGKSSEDYAYLMLSSGISPDDRSLATQLNAKFRLQTRKVLAGYRFTFHHNILFVQTSFSTAEYMVDTRDRQINGSVGYFRNF